MSKGKGHIPIRTCISCGRKENKKSMIRLVLNEDGIVIMDKSGSAPGRGAYVCNETQCIELLKEKKRLARAFGKMGRECARMQFAEIVRTISGGLYG
jgi:uncharacterized protein